MQLRRARFLLSERTPKLISELKIKKRKLAGLVRDQSEGTFDLLVRLTRLAELG